ncbi:hypothetical protein BDB01DRAFT_807211 [Pilobolus umbonatus]|nr:hypothetical protein BDB01DRAFT_807211 [Pilobolus umbonatus]
MSSTFSPAISTLNNNSTLMTPRKEIVIVFVVDGTAKMKPHFNTIHEVYVEPIIK